MQIKQQMLAQQVQKKIAPLYLLIGQDAYLMEESLSIIKSAIKKKYDCDERILSIQTPGEWNSVREEANSYSLFSEMVLLTIFFDKKTLDANGKKILTQYLGSINPRCVIIINAPNITAKQIQWLSSNEHTVVSIAYPLNPAAMKQWIIQQLHSKLLQFEPKIPDLIHQYTQGNMLACAQVIEKLALSNTPNSTISTQQVQDHLSDQCDYNLFELVEACLLGQSIKAIEILRHAAHNKTEPTLVLWVLAQEVRIILQFAYLAQHGTAVKSAASQLKIWPQKIYLYQECSKRLSSGLLQQLHHYCYLIDEHIKSNAQAPVWNSLENLALALCIGKFVGDICSI